MSKDKNVYKSDEYRGTLDGTEIHRGSESECFGFILNNTPSSVHYATRYEGYSIEPITIWRVAKCEHTNKEVVQIKEQNEDWLCLHEDTPELDKKSVEEFEENRREMESEPKKEDPKHLNVGQVIEIQAKGDDLVRNKMWETGSNDNWYDEVDKVTDELKIEARHIDKIRNTAEEEGMVDENKVEDLEMQLKSDIHDEVEQELLIGHAKSLLRRTGHRVITNL